MAKTPTNLGLSPKCMKFHSTSPAFSEAMAMATAAFLSGDVARIILTRPAVEAGEKLGFLPGGLMEKVDPYLRPMYDALYEMLGYDKVSKLIERNVIEIAPLAFMRGRTLNDAFIILDEAQTIKNANTAGAKAARLLNGTHRLALSGTPVWRCAERIRRGAKRQLRRCSCQAKIGSR